ncbi:MAG: hypothetical protein QXZ65_08210, partial [Metallosphaera sp.]
MIKLRTFFIVLFVVFILALSVYFIVESLVPNSPFVPSYNVSYGTFRVPVYINSGEINYSVIKGIKLVIDNEDSNSLQISAITNSTYSITPSSYYQLESVPLYNGSFVDGYVKTYEIYLGYDTVIIPVELSPGLYTVYFSNGNQLTFN